MGRADGTVQRPGLGPKQKPRENEDNKYKKIPEIKKDGRCFAST